MIHALKKKNEQIKQIWIIKFWRRRYFVEQLDEGHVSARQALSG